MIQHRAAHTLSGGDFGWLKARHHFKVTRDGNPAHGPLGALVVWNDDEVAPGTGFGLHPHADMEIITFVREGSVSHRDSTGGVGHIHAGDVQVMSAGTGIRHAERNEGDVPLRIFQIWLLPRERGGPPRWASRRFPDGDRAGRLVTLASGRPGDGDALSIRADARVLGATLRSGEVAVHALEPGRMAYLAPSSGVVRVNGCWLVPGDGLAAVAEPQLEIRAEEDAEIVLVDAA